LAKESNVPSEAVPGVSLFERLFGRLHDALESLGEHGGDQRASGREVPIDGSVADARLSSDVIDRRVQASLTVDEPSGCGDCLPVPSGVGPQPNSVLVPGSHAAMVALGTWTPPRF
jgi:hypothetical protein